MNSNHSAANPVLANLPGLLPDLEALYKDVHSHPELSMQESRTAGIAAERLRAAGYEVTTGVGNTGMVGLVKTATAPTGPASASEDFGSFGSEWGVPSVFWFIGGTEPGRICESEGGQPAHRDPDQPQPAFPAGDPSDARDRCRSAGSRVPRLAGGVGHARATGMPV
jgi:metal-dependent amidase/aminoacylase/carboxypeptidase family protein